MIGQPGDLINRSFPILIVPRSDPSAKVGVRMAGHTIPGSLHRNATHFRKSTMGVVGGLWGFMGVTKRRPQRRGAVEV